VYVGAVRIIPVVLGQTLPVGDCVIAPDATGIPCTVIVDETADEAAPLQLLATTLIVPDAVPQYAVAVVVLVVYEDPTLVPPMIK
jgi:hypothetical protein